MRRRKCRDNVIRSQQQQPQQKASRDDSVASSTDDRPSPGEQLPLNDSSIDSSDTLVVSLRLSLRLLVACQ